jgi:hypothetical protein
MPAVRHSHHEAFHPIDAGRPVGVFGYAEYFGRELVWLLIAIAFCVVEAAVFLTDLPIAKLFSRHGGRR